MRALVLMIALTGLAACGGGTESGSAAAEAGAEAAAGVAGIAAKGAAQDDAPITATREEVEETWKCRGLIAAATAAKMLSKGDVPAEVAELPTSSNAYWANRTSRITAPGMTEAEIDALIAKSTRMLATREALERELPNIRACREAEQAD